MGARGVMGRFKSITPCALTFPSLETSCKPLRRREDADGVPGVSEFKILLPRGEEMSVRSKEEKMEDFFIKLTFIGR